MSPPTVFFKQRSKGGILCSHFFIENMEFFKKKDIISKGRRSSVKKLVEKLETGPLGGWGGGLCTVTLDKTLSRVLVC